MQKFIFILSLVILFSCTTAKLNPQLQTLLKENQKLLLLPIRADLLKSDCEYYPEYTINKREVASFYNQNLHHTLSQYSEDVDVVLITDEYVLEELFTFDAEYKIIGLKDSPVFSRLAEEHGSSLFALTPYFEYQCPSQLERIVASQVELEVQLHFVFEIWDISNQEMIDRVYTYATETKYLSPNRNNEHYLLGNALIYDTVQAVSKWFGKTSGLSSTR